MDDHYIFTTNRANAFGSFIETFAWDHYVTLTTRFPTTPDGIRRAFEHKFIRRLTRRTGGRIPYFSVTEYSLRNGGHPHIHALIAGTREIAVKDIERAWTEGNTRIVRYIPGGGADYYITKSLNANPDYDLSRYFPRKIDKTP